MDNKELGKLKVARKLHGGRHCKSVTLLKKNIVKKSFNNVKVFNRELNALKTLQEYNFVPRLLGYDSKDLHIYMSYCGRSIDQAEFSMNKDKIKKMKKKLKEKGLYHNDVKARNICEHNGKLYLIDFSWCCEDKYIRRR
jgi:tRNA A-37 threonylcarbamoyl transferase component Bud32